MSNEERSNGAEIWPELLKALSAAGPSTNNDFIIAVLHEFALSTPVSDADTVVQYAIDDMGFIDVNVFYGSGDRWIQYDPEDGPRYDYPASWKSLSVIMARDRMTNMVLLRIADAAPATKKLLKAATEGSLATTRDGSIHTPLLLFKSHGEWIDLNAGADESYKSGQLVKFFGLVSPVWVAPETE